MVKKILVVAVLSITVLNIAAQGVRDRQKKMGYIGLIGESAFTWVLKFIFFNTGLFKDSIERSGRSVFVVHWYNGPFTGTRVQPDFVASTATV